jgi:hypothetical protein
MIFNGQAQLKVEQSGRIGIGIASPNPAYKCHIDGSLFLTFPNDPNVQFGFKVGSVPENTNYINTVIGSKTDQIGFYWDSNIGYNDLLAANFLKQSDASLKSNLTPILSPIDKIALLKPYLYSISANYYDNGELVLQEKPQYGFISQEVEKTLTEVKITEDGNGLKLMDYDQIIPLLVAAMQEQQKSIRKSEALITELNTSILELENQIVLLKGNNAPANNPLNHQEKTEIILYQNAPNPFSTNTTINCFIPEQIKNAQLCIYNMQGTQIECLQVNGRNQTSVEIQAGQLTSGVYIYLLLGDGKASEAKQMVLTR